MKKFWNKAPDSADIYIYGDIMSERWSDTDVTAKSFVEDLQSFNGAPVTVHINSGGGDVFAGLAISNAIKNYGNVTVLIDGLAASAASLIAMGGAKIVMAKNSLMMLHEPAVGLWGSFEAAELTKIQNALAAIRGTLIATYATRIDAAAAEKMVAAETWLNADEALAAGLVDEIAGEVEVKFDDAQQMIFVNSLAISTKKFDAVKMRRAMEVKTMDDKTFFDKLKAAITDVLTTKETSEPAPQNVEDAAAVREKELKRIRDLQALKCENAAVNSLIDLAINRGDTADEIQPYIGAVKSSQDTTAQNVADKIVAVIRDQMTSGAQNVAGGQQAPTPEDVKAAQQKRIVDYANGIVKEA